MLLHLDSPPCPFPVCTCQLSYLVRQHDLTVGQLQPTIKPLIRPHLEDMERKITPGFALLTWNSMNIDGYLHRFKQVCGATGCGDEGRGQ